MGTEILPKIKVGAIIVAAGESQRMQGVDKILAALGVTFEVVIPQVEEVIYATQTVIEVAAVGVPHPLLGQAIVLFVYKTDWNALDAELILGECQRQLPGFMVPARVIHHGEPLPRNPNGKIDRKRLVEELIDLKRA